MKHNRKECRFTTRRATSEPTSKRDSCNKPVKATLGGVQITSTIATVVAKRKMHQVTLKTTMAKKKVSRKAKAPARKSADRPEGKKKDSKMKDVVSEVVGEDSLPIVDFLQGKSNISDFKIADKVDKDIHEVRNILYRLYNQNLVTYYRKKDRQKGWYISYWTFNKARINDLKKNLHRKKLEKFSAACPGKGESGQFLHLPERLHPCRL